jgi:large subunit ribosomal protein L7e
MSSAKGGLPKKRLHFVEGGQYGDREELINSLVRKMN